MERVEVVLIVLATNDMFPLLKKEKLSTTCEEKMPDEYGSIVKKL